MNKTKLFPLLILLSWLVMLSPDTGIAKPKTIQSVQTVAASRDAKTIGKALDPNTQNLIPYTRYFVSEPPQKIILSDQGAISAIFESFPDAEFMLHNLYRYKKDDLYGVADIRGNVIIEPSYADLWVFEIQYAGTTQYLLWIEYPRPDENQDSFRAQIQQLIDLKTGKTLNQEPLYGLLVTQLYSAFQKDGWEGLVPVQPVSADGPQGYMDILTGKITIPARYYTAKSFSEGRAVVQITHQHAHELCQETLPPHIQSSCRLPHQSPPPCDNSRMAIAEEEDCINAESNDGSYYGYGVIDRNGTLISGFNYDWIGPYQNGFAIFMDTSRPNTDEIFGFLDTDGHELPARFIDAENFHNHTAAVRTQTPNDEGCDWFNIDENGNLIASACKRNPEEPEPVSQTVYPPAATPFTILNTSKPVTGNSLDVYIFSETVIDANDEKHAVILVNHQGHVVWPHNWDNPCDDTQGYISWPESACSIDKTQRKIRDFLTQNIFGMFINNMSGGILQFLTSDKIYRTAFTLANKFEYFKSISLPPLGDYLSQQPHYARLAFGPKNTAPNNPRIAEPGRGFGIIDTDTGKVLFRPGQYPFVSHLVGNLFAFKKSGQAGIMDERGNILAEPRFADIRCEQDEEGNDYLIAAMPELEISGPQVEDLEKQTAELSRSYAKRYHLPEKQYHRVCLFRRYDISTGLPIEGSESLQICHPNEYAAPLALDNAQHISQMESSPWTTHAIEDINGNLLSEYLLNEQGQLYEPSDALSEYNYTIEVLDSEQRMAIVHISNNRYAAYHQMDDEDETQSWYELRCLDSHKYAPFPFMDYGPQTLAEGLACVTLAETQDNGDGNSLEIISKNYFISCSGQKIIEVNDCRLDATRFVNDHAWIRAKGESTWKRYDKSGNVDGNFEIYAADSEDPHRMNARYESSGIYRFPTSRPSPKDGWKYLDILVNSEGNIIWPRNWNDPCHDTFGNIVWPPEVLANCSAAPEGGTK